MLQPLDPHFLVSFLICCMLLDGCMHEASFPVYLSILTKQKKLGLAYKVAALKHHCSSSRNMNYCSTKVIFLHRCSLIKITLHSQNWHGSCYWKCTLPYSNKSLQNPLHTTIYLIIYHVSIVVPLQKFYHIYTMTQLLFTQKFKEFKAAFFENWNFQQNALKH